MNVLIVGGFGHLGSHYAEILSKNNHNITLLARKIPYQMREWCEKFEVILGDITDINLKDKLINKKFDCVIHFAGVKTRICKKNPCKALKVNGFGTKNILEICSKINVKKFIYLSTYHIYGMQKSNSKLKETNSPNPINDYGITKYFGELYCKQYSEVSDMKFVILRLSNVYSGPLFNLYDRWESVPNNFVKQIFEDKKIIINSSGNQIRNFVSIKDLYCAINLCLNNKLGKFEIFNIGGEYNYSINEIANKTVQIYKKIFKDEDIPIIHNNRDFIDESISCVFDISKIKAIGYKAQNDIQNEIKKTIVNYGKMFKILN